MPKHAFMVGRIGDNADASKKAHQCARCSDRSSGPSVTGSANVMVNGKAVLRVGDSGLHSNSCQARSWSALQGSPCVLINGRSAFRLGDPTSHKGGSGQLVQGSNNTLIGNFKIEHEKPLSVSALLALGATLAVQKPSGIAPLLGSLAGESVPWLLARGLPKAIFKLMGKTMKPWVDMLTDALAVASWIAWHTVRIKGKLCVEWARWFFTNHIDNILDGDPRHAWNNCPVLTQSQQAPVYPIIEDINQVTAALKASADTSTWGEASLDSLDAVLHYFQPIEYQYSDDLPPITLGSILKHSILVIDGQPQTISGDNDEVGTLRECSSFLGGSAGGYIDIDDDFAHGVVFLNAHRRTVYGSARLSSGEKEGVGSGEQLVLEYQHLRAGSYLPTKQISEDAFCHEGDGETAKIVISACDGEITGTITGGHGYEVPCSTILFESYEDDLRDPQVIDQRTPPSRPVIFIGHGSHSIASTPGKREARHGNDHKWVGGVTDWHPPQQESEEVDRFLPDMITPKNKDEYHLKELIIMDTGPLHLGVLSDCE